MNHKDNQAGHSPEDRIEALLREAAVRERPSKADETAIREALHAEWKAATTKRKRLKAGGFAVAAALLVAVLAFQLNEAGSGPAPAAVTLASVDIIEGIAETSVGDEPPTGRVTQDSNLSSGTSLSTTAGAALSLTWRDGSSVRIDQQTRLRLTHAGEIELLEGQVYIDSRDRPADTLSPALLTPAGLVRHTGTRYMTSVEAGQTRVRVRDGAVALDWTDGAHTANEGQEVSASAGTAPVVRNIATYGEDWAWADSLAEPFDANGRTIAEFLEWVGHETGHEIRYESPRASQLAHETQLRGEVTLDPMRALDLVLQTSELSAQVDHGIITVRLRTSN